MFLKDQCNRTVVITSAKRIVSAVPSQTMLLSSLGLEKEVIGITKFCIHPQNWYRSKTRIGGTKTINIQAVTDLQPDLILANKEENEKEQIEVLEQIAPVWVSDIPNYADALEMINSIGIITGKTFQAEKLVAEIEERFSRLIPFNPKIAACYLIWKDPYMTVGGDTFINSMMNICGLKNIFEKESRYPQVTLQQIAEKNCRLVLLSSEPYPFKEKHIHSIKNFLPQAEIVLANGELFSWYGSSMLDAPKYFERLMSEIKSYNL